MKMKNALTIDVEDYFMVSAFADRIKFDDWPCFESRVERNTQRLLDLLDEFSVKATFFVLGYVAHRHPGLVAEIASRGHEIGSHGYAHELIYRIGPERFRADVRRSKAILEEITGLQVCGYRAPSYSIVARSLWALDILIEEGYRYDSSIFPIRHDIYGIPDAMRFPFLMQRPSGKIHEFPLSTLAMRVGNRELRFPVAGGGYLRLFPVWMIRKAISHINNAEGGPAIVYLHPWEIDPHQPRIRAGLKSRFRHYINLDTTMVKIRDLLMNFQFEPASVVLGYQTPASSCESHEDEAVTLADRNHVQTRTL